MNIAFSALFYKTIFFNAVAERLETEGHNIFWFTTSVKWKDWLVEKGVNEHKILVLRRDEANSCSVRAENSIITSLESKTGYNLKGFVLMDRVVRNWGWKEAEKYLIYIIDKLQHFFGANNIELVIAEGTVLHELVASALCSYLKIPIYNVSTVRIPSERFVFFEGHLQAKILEFSSADEVVAKMEKATTVFERVTKRQEKPNYWHWSNVKPTIDKEFFKIIFKKISEALFEPQYDANAKTFAYHFKYEKKYLKPWRNLISKNIFESSLPDEKYVLYALHKEPESSIDVFGEDHSNQIEMIKGIIRNIPYGTKLYVKEHSNCLGDRPLDYYRQIKNMPEVRLISPKLDIHSLIKGAELVVTVSGTVAFEAGLYGKKVAIFSNMYFNELSQLHYINSHKAIKDILKLKTSAGDFAVEDQKFLAKLLANSFPGIIADAMRSMPMGLAEENIKNVTEGFLYMLRYLEE